MISFISLNFNPAPFGAEAVTVSLIRAIDLSMKSFTSSSNFALVIVSAKCLGPDASDVM